MGHGIHLHDATGIVCEVPALGVTLAVGTTVPADGSVGYAPGCIFQDIDASAGSQIFVNEGTKASADFNAIASAAGSYLPLAGGTLTDGANIVLGASTGNKIGTSATAQKLGFFNATPVVQPTNAAQAAVVTTGSTNSSPYGFATAAQGDAIVTLVNRIRTDLIALGLIKGS